MNWESEIIKSFNWAVVINLCLIVFNWVFMDHPWVEDIWQFGLAVLLFWVISIGVKWLEYLYKNRNGIN